MRAWLLLFVLAASPIARASTTDLIRSAEAAEADLEYDHAAELWLEVLAQPGLSVDDRVRALFRLGAVQRVRGIDSEARAHFRSVLELRPDFVVPEDAPPKVRGFFELVRQEVAVTRPAATPSTSSTTSATPPASSAAPPSATGAGVATASSTPAAAAAPAATPSLLPTALLVGGAGAAALGVVGIGVGGWARLESSTIERAALAEPVQTARDALYDERDAALLLANVAFVAGTTLVVVGGGAAAASLLVGE